MTENDAIQVARGLADKNDWPWHGKVTASLHKPLKVFSWLFGARPYWHVVSNAEMRGCNLRVSIDDETGEIIASAFCPR